MPRRASVRWFESKKGYYARVNGKPVRMGDGPDDGPNGPNHAAAVKRWAAMLCEEPAEERGQEHTLRYLCERWAQEGAGELAPSTKAQRLVLLAPFMKHHGEDSLAIMGKRQVKAFLERQRQARTVEIRTEGKRAHQRKRQWGDGTCAAFLEALNVAIEWAVAEEIVKGNPFRRIKPPKKRSRSREAVLLPGDHEKVLKVVRGRELRALVVALESTGARPGELTGARGRDFDPEMGAIHYFADRVRTAGEFRHKTAGKGKERIIVLRGETLAYCRARWEENPEALLFPNRYGTEYRPGSVQAVCRRIATAAKLPHFSAYSYRHTYATRWLLAGGPVELLAASMGNSPATIYRHYSHLLGNPQALRNAVEKFTRPAGKTGR